MAHFYPQGLLLLFLFIDISECRDGSPLLVTVLEEEEVVLPCFDSKMMDPKSCYRVKLIKYATDASQMKVILARPKTTKFPDAERVKLQTDGNGQISLFVTKSQKSDEGLYGCEIWKGWDFLLVKNITLRVKDCKTLQPVKAALSTQVKLKCPVDRTSGQQGPQNISWAMLKGGDPVSVNSKIVEINLTSLAIQSVNYSDNGWYRCNYMFGQTQRCFDIKLLVEEVEHVRATTVPGITTSPLLTTSAVILETKEEGSSGAFIAIVVTSVITGTAIMAALMGLFIYCRRNTHSITQQTQRHQAGTLTLSTGAYEIVNLTLSDNRTNHRVNSLYQLPNESLCTFR